EPVETLGWGRAGLHPRAPSRRPVAWYSVSLWPRARRWLLVSWCSALPCPCRSIPAAPGTMASADFCSPFPNRYRFGSLSAGGQISWGKRSFFRPAPAGSTASRFGNHGFHCHRPAHPPLGALYPVRVPQVVAVAPASSGRRLAATPLPSLNGSDSLVRRGLAPPRTSTCPAHLPSGRP